MIRREIENQHGEHVFTIGETAKMLNIRKNGKRMGRNTLFKLLRENGILMKKSNQPYQKMITLDLMYIKEVKKGSYTVSTIFVTPKGIDYLKNKFRDMIELNVDTETGEIKQELEPDYQDLAKEEMHNDMKSYERLMRNEVQPEQIPSYFEITPENTNVTEADKFNISSLSVPELESLLPSIYSEIINRQIETLKE